MVSIEYGQGIAIVRINREEKRNAFNMALVDAVTEAAAALRKRRDVKVVVLTGTQKCFSAGADLSDPLQFDEEITLADKRYYALVGAEMIKAWEQLPQVTIAAVERYAIGGGLSLALSCDFRVTGEGAFLWVPEVAIGANYGWNTVPKLVSMVGPARTRRMVMLAQRVSAADGLDWGLVDEVAPDGKVLEQALVLAQQLHDMPSMALQVSKRAINVVANAMGDISSHGDMEQVLLCFSDWGREKATQEQVVA
jgi:enoyl-CoA hydratase/carnithine racemase